MLDFLKPLYYTLEKSMASKSILEVHVIPNRSTVTFDHSLWNTILQTYVLDDTGITTMNQVDGIHTVDYSGVPADPTFAEYSQLLDKAGPTNLSGPELLALQ